MSNTVRPAKYKTLIQAGAAGLRTPRSLLLQAMTNAAAVDDFIANSAVSARFIVRSAYSGEDGSQQSYAGHFYSSDAVSAIELADAITQTWAENQRIAKDLRVAGQLNLLVQEYIEHDIGGVLFAPWSFFSDYACVEFSAGGVQQVVAGQAQIAIPALDAAIESPLPLPEDLSYLLPELQAVCHTLCAEFDFPIDCEWAWSAEQRCLVVLQVRPQTHAVGSVLPLPASQQPELPAGDWQYSALSESLGRLSPLAFSLLQQLYHDMIPLFQRLGCVAAECDFLLRIPDGTVLVDLVREQQFYMPTRFGGFWRGFRAEPARQRIVRDFSAVNAKQPFTYSVLTKLFSGWMLSNFLSDGAGRAQKVTPHAYELSWYKPAIEQVADPAIETSSSWQVLNEQGRGLFMQELNKLKRELLQCPQCVFCDWQVYQAGDYTDAALKNRQHQAAALAIYDYAAVTSGEAVDTETLSLAAKNTVTGPACIIQQPGQHRGELPTDCILIAPYFDNCWVNVLRGLAGVVVQRGSHLSHSVIVAREYGVPYCVMPELDIASFAAGMTLTLDPVKKALIVESA